MKEQSAEIDGSGTGFISHLSFRLGETWSPPPTLFWDPPMP